MDDHMGEDVSVPREKLERWRRRAESIEEELRSAITYVRGNRRRAQMQRALERTAQLKDEIAAHRGPLVSPEWVRMMAEVAKLDV